MRSSRLCGLFVWGLFAASPAFARTPGTFRGVIVRPPQREQNALWIYLAGKNGMVRRAEASHANVFYASDVPGNQRQSQPRDSLTEGAEVRVTAEQDIAGEWRALSIEILKTGKQTTRPKLHTSRLDRPLL